MKSYSSRPVIVKESAEAIFAKFSDFNNFRYMLPPDKVNKFECTETECTFSIKGAPDITLVIVEATPHERIIYGTKDQKPINLQFGVDISNVNNHTSELKLYINVEIDSFLMTLLSRPLQNLVDSMAEKIEKSQQ